MQERVRICDIAEELGLSPATVSNVIHGKTNKVSDETVQRVTALLEKRQYIPSMAGILLAQNSSGIIGVFVNDHPKYAGHTLRDGFIAASLDALSTEIEAGGQFMMVKKAQCAGEVVRFASMWNMDGIVMIGFCEQDYMDLRRHIRIPIAVYDGLCGQLERMLNLSIDNYGGGYLVGCHFRELGHRELLCVSDNETGIDRARIEGFRHGAAPGAAQLLLVPMQKEERWAYYRQQLERLGGEDYDEAYQAAKRLMVYGAVGAAVLCTVVLLTSGAYVEIYRVSPTVKLMTRQILSVYAMAAPFKVLNMILGGGILRSGGRTAYVMGIDMLGTWAFGVPLGLLGAFVWRLPIAYVYLLLSLEECVRFAISMAVFRRKRWMRRLDG
jgi:DNA-binding LacI/PurR family transcriptional regulator